MNPPASDNEQDRDEVTPGLPPRHPLPVYRSISGKLLVLMLGSGIGTGLVFPFFTRSVLQLPADRVLTPLFFSMCVMAGLFVGIFNFYASRRVTYGFLEEISRKLMDFRKKLNTPDRKGLLECDGDDCLIHSHMTDPITGNIVESFNDFILTIRDHFKTDLIFNRFLDRLKHGLKIRDVAEIVVSAFMEFFGADGGCIIGYERGEFAPVKSINVAMDRDALKPENLERILFNAQIQVLDGDAEEDFKLDLAAGPTIPGHLAFIPLTYQNQRIGVCILLSNKPFKRDFSSLESRNFVNQATPFLYNSTLIQRLEVIAAIDELTGVLNRRFGMKRLNEEFDRSRRHGVPFSIAMLDIDDFKQLNDSFGHPCGDNVLKHLTRHISEHIRMSDFILRYGGDEFIIVLPGASMDDTVRILERFRREVEGQIAPFGAYQVRYTFSCGICTYPAPDIEDVEAMIAFVDKAMYAAKRQGKNRLIVSEIYRVDAAEGAELVPFEPPPDPLQSQETNDPVRCRP